MRPSLVTLAWCSASLVEWGETISYSDVAFPKARVISESCSRAPAHTWVDGEALGHAIERDLRHDLAGHEPGVVSDRWTFVTSEKREARDVRHETELAQDGDDDWSERTLGTVVHFDDDAEWRLSETDRDDRFGATFDDDVAGERTRELVVETPFAGDQQRFGEHGITDATERSSESLVSSATERDIFDSSRERDEWKCKRRRAATVNRHGERALVETRSARDGFAHQRLGSARRLQIGLGSIPETPREKQESSMLSRAIVPDRVALLAVHRAFVAEPQSYRKMRSALERFGSHARASEQPSNDFDVLVGSVVRRARDRELVFAESELVRYARRDERQRLQRLGRRAKREAPVRIAERVRERPVLADDGDCRPMLRFDAPASSHAHCDVVSGHRASVAPPVAVGQG